MTTTGQRLAEAQLAGHRALDEQYKALSVLVFGAVTRYAIPDDRGVLRLAITAVRPILIDIRRLMAQAQAGIVRVIDTTVRGSVAAAHEGFPPLNAFEESAVTFPAHRQAVESLDVAQPMVLRQTDALLTRGIAAGLAASTVGRTVKDYFYRRNPETGLITTWPGKANMASFIARTVMLTETTTAHGRITKAIAEREDMGLKWNVSFAHSKPDECDSKRQGSSRGQDSGVYLPSEFPTLPSHPWCRCWSSIVPLRDAP
jgi:hypothetical protein